MVRIAFSIALAAAAALVPAVTLAAPSDVPRQRSLPAADPAASMSATESFIFRLTWNQLLPKGSRHEYRKAEVRGGYSCIACEAPKPSLFRLLWADVTAAPSPTLEDDEDLAGGACGWYGGGAFHPETCSRIHVTAHFTLTDPSGLRPVEPVDPPLWCMSVYDAGGEINHLRNPRGCRGATVSLGWADAKARAIGAVPLWTVEGSTLARLDSIHEAISSIVITVSTSAGKPTCGRAPTPPPKPGAATTPTPLSGKLKQYEELQRSLRRIEKQRAALRGKLAVLEEAGHEVGLLYFRVAEEVATKLLAGPALTVLGKALKRGKAAGSARYACKLSPAQQERLVLNNMRVLGGVRDTQAKLMKQIGSALEKGTLSAEEARLVDRLVDLFGDLTRIGDQLYGR